MRAAWYEKQGPPSESLVVGDMPEPVPGPGELRISVAASGVNPMLPVRSTDAEDWNLYR